METVSMPSALSPSRLTNPLKWHGGKYYIAQDIVAMMPPHIHYVEPFAGGLSVLLAKNPVGVSEVINDLNGDLTNFWRVLQDEDAFSRFVRKVSAIPFSEVEWRSAKQALLQEDCDSVQRAVSFFVFCRQSHSGRMRQFATLTRNRTRRKMSEQASAWLGAVDGLAEVHERLRRVVVLNHAATKVIQEQDGANTLFYLDPPYVHDTRSTVYEYGEQEMSLDAHQELLAVVRAATGKFMISGYAHPLYDALLEIKGWRRVDFELPNNAASGASKRRMTECVWMNF